MISSGRTRFTGLRATRGIIPATKGKLRPEYPQVVASEGSATEFLRESAPVRHYNGIAITKVYVSRRFGIASTTMKKISFSGLMFLASQS
jgi:hypothetical protein